MEPLKVSSDYILADTLILMLGGAYNSRVFHTI